MSRDRNADYVAVVTTSVAVHTPPAVREPSGEPAGTVACPLCRTTVELLASVGRVEGRCSGCTVIVRLVDGRPVARGWMGGGDMKRAGAALRLFQSSLEIPVVEGPAGDKCGDAIGTTAGYYRHRTAHDPACQYCLAAYRLYNRTNRAQRLAARRDALKPCGTDAAHRRHLRAGEEPCDLCRAAHAAVQSTRERARSKARKAQAA